MDFTLRSVSTADYAWLWALKELTTRAYIEQTWGVWDEVVQEDFFRQGFDSEPWQIVVVGGHYAGLIHVARPGSEIFLGIIYLHPDFQNVGLGTAVIRTLQAEASLLRVPLRLQVMKVNPARRLYERLGFLAFEETPTHILMRWHPA